jgi:hypothetical protein
MSQDWDSYYFAQGGSCLHCGATLDGLTGPKEGPSKGALMVCAKCAYVMEWDGEKLAEMSAETLEEVSKDPDVAQMLAVTRALRGLPGIPDRVIILESREPEICEDCGRFMELRPYGRKIDGKRQWVCFDCSQKDPKNSQEAFEERMRGELTLDRGPDERNRAERRRAASRRRRGDES